jgi:type I restriction enzyme M protein
MMSWISVEGIRKEGNSDWLQHFIHRLAPQGMSGLDFDPGRRALIEADLLDGMVALPGQFLYSMEIPVCLWVSGKNEAAGKCLAVCEIEVALAA